MKPLMTKRLGRLQFRLQKGRLWPLGNALSSLRYWAWRATGGKIDYRPFIGCVTITLDTEQDTAAGAVGFRRGFFKQGAGE